MQLRTETTIFPVLAAAGGVAIMSAMDAVMKVVSEVYPIGEVVGLRYATGAAFALLAFFATRERAPGFGALRRNFTRSIVVLITAASFFTAIGRLPLAEAVALTFIAPLMLSLLGRVVLKEPIAPRATIGILLGLVGVGVIAHGQQIDSRRAYDLIGILAALSCAFFYALSNTLMRQQSGHDRIGTLVMLTNCFAFVLVSPLMLVHWQTPTFWHWWAFVVAGLMGTAGHYCMAWAYARASAGRLGVLEYTAFFWASIYGYLFFAEQPAIWTVAGAALILLACLASTSRWPRRAEAKV
jgi:drug/metabolite transporter (DMT)-like permease